MTDQPTLWDVGPPDEGVQEILDRMDWTHREYLDGVRAVLYVLAQTRPVSADDYWRLVAEEKIPPLPDGVSHNVLGALFKVKRFETVGWKRSERDGANGNLLRTWRAV